MNSFRIALERRFCMPLCESFTVIPRVHGASRSRVSSSFTASVELLAGLTAVTVYSHPVIKINIFISHFWDLCCCPSATMRVFVSSGPCWVTAWSEPTYRPRSHYRGALTASPVGFRWRWWASAKVVWSWTRWCTNCPAPAPTRRCPTLSGAFLTCSGWTAATREEARPGWLTGRCWRNWHQPVCLSTPTWPPTRCVTRCGRGWAVSTSVSSRRWRSWARVRVRSCTLRMILPPSRTTSGSSRNFELLLRANLLSNLVPCVMGDL